MNKQELIKSVSDLLSENKIKKHITTPKQVFHISDDDGNSKDFSIKQTEKTIAYTQTDIATIMEACLCVIQESLKRGEPVSIRGFGTLGLTYRKPRITKYIGTDEDVVIDGHFIPKFAFGNDLRMCAKMYELSLGDKMTIVEPFDDNLDDAYDGDQYKGGG